MARHFRTVRVDLRGHGDSPRVGSYDPLTLAADVHEVVRGGPVSASGCCAITRSSTC
ncbi:alpha/beta fold hydrolase [Micromonospora sp. URMC 105]|uniref:alpha/beta fold hydrolase n=1 Tax=Micromonospora sp. URMC 105 TaxID=3423413 RepID=UPI003F1D2F72